MRVPLAKDYPDHHDAELVLKTYEIRQEPLLRDSRRTIIAVWWPTSAEEAIAIAGLDHPHNTAFRQVCGYWELVYGLGRHGIVNPEYLADASGGEALILLAKVSPWLADLRQAISPRFLRNTEWIATETETGRDLFDHARTRVERIRAARQAVP